MLETISRQMLEHLKAIRPKEASLGMTITMWAHPNENRCEFRVALLDGTRHIFLEVEKDTDNLVHRLLKEWYNK